MTGIGVAALLCLLGLGLHRASQKWIERTSRSRVVHSLEEIDDRARIVVLGCRPRRRDGRPSPLFVARVAAAAAAFHRNRSRRILCSGRLDRDGLHEADELARALLEADVEADSIDLDRDARRTIDSIAHLRDRHAHEPIVLVTQRFHLARAIFLAHRAGLRAQGLPAGDSSPGWRLRWREAFARDRAVLESLVLRRVRARWP